MMHAATGGSFTRLVEHNSYEFMHIMGTCVDVMYITMKADPLFLFIEEFLADATS